MLRLVILCAAGLIASATAASAQQSLVERGSYLVNGIGVCGNCHSPRGGDTKSFGGGTNVFATPAYTVRGANLTPHPEAGLGKWSDAEIKTALTQGKRPNGSQLAPNMPYPLYGVLTERDKDAIVAYLRSLPPVATPVDPPVYKAEFKVSPYPPAAKPMTEADLADPVKRGLYLASLGHCAACHSKLTESGDMDYGPTGLGAGGRRFGGPQGATAANISSHPTKGLGGWTDAQIKATLVSGKSHGDGRELKPPMVEFAPFYATLTDADLSAIVAWLRSLPPLE
jgi:mono/diheme cytochrome c family protein